MSYPQPQKTRRRITRRPEQVMQIHVADALRWLRPACVWFAVPNEGRRGRVATAYLKRMGMKLGVADMVFLWEFGCGAIEHKDKNRKQSEPQSEFELECKKHGVPYRVSRSFDETIKILIEWGRLPPDTLDRLRGVDVSPRGRATRNAGLPDR